jgi:hypothetical protein
MPSASLTDQTDGDGVVSTDDTVRVTAAVTDDDQIDTVEAAASSFDPKSGSPITLTDGGPGASGSDTYGAEFTVGSSLSDGSQSVDVTVTDENQDQRTETTGTLTVDTQDPSISSVSLSSFGIPGVADVGDTIRVTAKDVSGTGSSITEVKVKDTDNPFADGEITLSDTGPGVSSNDTDYSKEFSLSPSDLQGLSGSQTLTVTVTDEAGHTTTKNSSPLTVPPATGNLVSYWKLDSNNVKDYVGSNDGAVNEDEPGNVSFTTLNATNTTAAKFDHDSSGDDNGYIDCGSDQSLDVDNTFTISAYFKPTEVSQGGGSDDEGIVSRDVEAIDRIWSLRVNGGTETVKFLVDSKNNGFQQAEVQTSVNENDTYHAVGRFDHGKLYLSVYRVHDDGDVDSVGTGDKEFGSNVDANKNHNVPLRIGFYYTDDERAMEGMIDEVKYFDTALTDSEIQDLHMITE